MKIQPRRRPPQIPCAASRATVEPGLSTVAYRDATGAA